MRENGGMSEPIETPTGVTEERASIRRAPKVPVFMLLGAMLGVVSALVLTSVFEVDPLVGFAATFGYLCIYLIPAGLVLGALVALAFDARSRRRAREVTVAHDVAVGRAAHEDSAPQFRSQTPTEERGPASD